MEKRKDNAKLVDEINAELKAQNLSADKIIWRPTASRPTSRGSGAEPARELVVAFVARQRHELDGHDLAARRAAVFVLGYDDELLREPSHGDNEVTAGH
jgi:hypothetical protein